MTGCPGRLTSHWANGSIWFFTGTFVEKRKWSLSWYTEFAAAEPAGITYP